MDSYSPLTTGELVRTLLCKADQLTDLEVVLLLRLEQLQDSVLDMVDFVEKNPTSADRLEALDDLLEDLAHQLSG